MAVVAPIFLDHVQQDVAQTGKSDAGVGGNCALTARTAVHEPGSATQASGTVRALTILGPARRAREDTPPGMEMNHKWKVRPRASNFIRGRPQQPRRVGGRSRL